MFFELKCSNQCEIASYQLRAAIYEKAGEWSQETEWMRGTGIFLGLTDAAIQVALLILNVVEPIMKGFANIFIGLYRCERRKMMSGLKQIFLATYYNSTRSLLYISHDLIWNLLVPPLAMLVDPQEYTKNSSDARKRCFQVLRRQAAT